MEIMVAALIAAAAFIATNMDDVFILMSFFATNNSKVKLVLGQYLGFLIILAMCLLCYQFKFVFPEKYWVVIGLLPIFIGIKYFWNYRKDVTKMGDLQNSFSTSRSQNELGLNGSKSVLAVAMTTVANGGDNLAVYIPLFFSMGSSEIVITMLTFMVMIGIWCVLAYKMVNNRIFGDKLKIYGHIIFPSVLILIGAGIIIRNLHTYF